VANESAGRVRFVEEDYGASELARRFGVSRYPALFVEDVLLATPKDFGFYGRGEGEGEGRYTPWRSAESHALFRADLERVIALLLAGRHDEAQATVEPASTAEIARLPDLELRDLDGRPLRRADLAGEVVVVELWATWCPPCHPTLRWLGEQQRRHGDRLRVVTVAVQSDAADVRKVAGRIEGNLFWSLATPELARALGDVTTVPTTFVFDRDGKTATVRYGAPPDLHAEVEATLAGLLAR
jgi:thiol-disulfide isomerase/thioredoxin